MLRLALVIVLLMAATTAFAQKIISQEEYNKEELEKYKTYRAKIKNITPQNKSYITGHYCESLQFRNIDLADYIIKNDPWIKTDFEGQQCYLSHEILVLLLEVHKAIKAKNNANASKALGTLLNYPLLKAQPESIKKFVGTVPFSIESEYALPLYQLVVKDYPQYKPSLIIQIINQNNWPLGYKLYKEKALTLANLKGIALKYLAAAYKYEPEDINQMVESKALTKSELATAIYQSVHVENALKIANLIFTDREFLQFRIDFLKNSLNQNFINSITQSDQAKLWLDTLIQNIQTPCEFLVRKLNNCSSLNTLIANNHLCNPAKEPNLLNFLLQDHSFDRDIDNIIEKLLDKNFPLSQDTLIQLKAQNNDHIFNILKKNKFSFNENEISSKAKDAPLNREFTNFKIKALDIRSKKNEIELIALAKEIPYLSSKLPNESDYFKKIHSYIYNDLFQIHLQRAPANGMINIPKKLLVASYDKFATLTWDQTNNKYLPKDEFSIKLSDSERISTSTCQGNIALFYHEKTPRAVLLNTQLKKIKDIPFVHAITSDQKYFYTSHDSSFNIYDCQFKLISSVKYPIEKDAHDILIQDGKAFLLDNIMCPIYLFIIDIANIKKPKLTAAIEDQCVNCHLNYQWINKEKKEWYVVSEFAHMGGSGHTITTYNYSNGSKISNLTIPAHERFAEVPSSFSVSQVYQSGDQLIGKNGAELFIVKHDRTNYSQGFTTYLPLVFQEDYHYYRPFFFKNMALYCEREKCLVFSISKDFIQPVFWGDLGLKDVRYIFSLDK